MEEAADFSTQLADIVSPAMPMVAVYGSMWLFLLSMGVLALLLWGTWRWRRSALTQAMRRLKHLRAAYLAQTLSPRDAAYWLALVVKQRMRINHLAAVIALPDGLVNEKSRWERFAHRIHEARYAPHLSGEQEIHWLITEAKYWIKRWP